MGNVRCHISVSLDGFVAGPEQSPAAPLGKGGEQLHECAVRAAAWWRQDGMSSGERAVASELVERPRRGVGAYVMGRGMFGGGPGPWASEWAGWWGEDPPLHVPVFVLTHQPRTP